MKILRIANVPNNHTGGMSRAIYGTGEALSAIGHEVSYLFSDQLPQFSWAGLNVIKRLFLSLRLPSIIRQIEKKQGRFDVVEIHEPLGAAACWVRRFSSKMPPIVIFSHGLEERGSQMKAVYGKRRGLSLSAKEKFSVALANVQAKYAVRHADHVLCCNSQDVTYLEGQGVNPNQLTRHFNGVEADFLERGQLIAAQRASQARAPRAILFVGSWVVRKGIFDLVAALNTVLQEFPDATFMAAGCSASREEIIGDFLPAVRSRVQITPHFEGNAALAEIYRAHDIFVLPSVFEGHPLVMVEAAACGLALVTTDICGMVDFIEPGRNGLMVPVGDVPALTEALRRLCDDSHLVRSLGKAAAVTANQHTWTLSAQKVATAYQKAMGQ